MKISFRTVADGYFSRSRFDEIIGLLDQYASCVDEVSFFEQTDRQGYYPLSDLAQKCELLDKQMKTLREHGVKSVGINSLITLGHADDSDFCIRPPFQTMVGHDGQISPNCMCPNSNEFRAYTREKYQMYARLKPDFIWVDDDARMNNHGVVQFACFCPICLGIFNQANQTRFTREELVERLNSPDGGCYRSMWVQQNTWTINRLYALIGQAVHEVDRSIITGLMALGLSAYNGPDYPQWLTSLEAKKIRPSGGITQDDRPLALLHRPLWVLNHLSAVPLEAFDVLYELENFPYQSLQKSAYMLIMECTASLMNGCNGLTINALYADPQTNQKYMAAIDQYHALWREMDRISNKYINRGLHPASSPTFEARRSVSNGNWFKYPSSLSSASSANNLNEIGIPLTMSPQDACAVILIGNMAEGYTKEELRKMLVGGVLMDVRTLELLTEAGLGEYCGVKIAAQYDFNVYEQYTADSLNGANASLSSSTTGLAPRGFYSYTLKPMDPKVKILNNLMTNFGEFLGPTMTAYENALGGRVVVNGYNPWNSLYSIDKIEQMRNVCDWISWNRMPVFIYGCVKVVPFIKTDDHSKNFLLMLTNACFDETGAFDIEIRVAGLNKLFILNPDGSRTAIDPANIIQDDRKTLLHIDHIGPWQFMIITGEGT